MAILGMVLGILGLIASIAGSVLAYFTFVDPRKRLAHYLDDVDSWESIHTTLGGHDEIWRYKHHPEFMVEIKEGSRDWDPEAKEPWMTMPLPDPNKTMYMVHVMVNGTILYAEKFIALDGWRYFVPLPRVIADDSQVSEDIDPANNSDSRKFHYERIQLQLSKIIGKLHGEKSIEEFAGQSNIEISEKKK